MTTIGNLAKVVHIAFSVNEEFADHLRVALHSAIENLRAGYELNVFVLNCGVGDETRRSVARAAPGTRIQWIDVDPRDCPPLDNPNFPPEAVLRLLLPKLLPDNCQKCIYLDSDLVVEGDLTELWCEELGDYAIAACQDYRLPFLSKNSPFLGDGFDRWRLENASVTLPEYEILGIAEGTPYFNSGVLVINVDLWRREQLVDKIRELSNRHRGHFVYVDQDVLNALLINRWKPLPPEWNQICPLRPEVRDALFKSFPKKSVRLIHYVGATKPWHFSAFWTKFGVGGEDSRKSRYFTYRYRVDPNYWRSPSYYAHTFFWLFERIIPGYLRFMRFVNRRVHGS